MIIEEVLPFDNDEVRIAWTSDGDPESITYEHYRLSGDTVVVAIGDSVDAIEQTLIFLRDW